MALMSYHLGANDVQTTRHKTVSLQTGCPASLLASTHLPLWRPSEACLVAWEVGSVLSLLEWIRQRSFIHPRLGRMEISGVCGLWGERQEGFPSRRAEAPRQEGTVQGEGRRQGWGQRR